MLITETAKIIKNNYLKEKAQEQLSHMPNTHGSGYFIPVSRPSICLINLVRTFKKQSF